MLWGVLYSWLGFSSQGLGKLNFCHIFVYDWFLLMICFGCWPLVAKRTCFKGRFHDVYALFHIVVHSVHVRCLIKCLLGIFSLVQTPMSTKLWGFSCILIRNMFGLLVVYLTHLTPYVYFLCFGHALRIAHCHLLHTLFLPFSCISLDLVSSSQHVMFTLCFVAFCFVFCLNFISHSSCIPHASFSLFIHSSLPSFLLDPLSICVKKGESI